MNILLACASCFLAGLTLGVLLAWRLQLAHNRRVQLLNNQLALCGELFGSGG